MAQKPQNTAEAEQPKKRGKLLMIVSLLVVLLGAGGGAAWFFMKPADASTQAKPKPALFLPLEMFTANLQSDEGQPQFVQLGLTLKMNDQEAVNLVKDRTPEVRNRILLVISGKRGSELLPVAGKEKLATDIATAIQGVIAPLVAKAPEAKPEEEKPAAEETDGGEVKASKAKGVAKVPAIEVLFTAFMIQ